MIDAAVRWHARELAKLSDEERKKSTAALYSFEHELHRAGLIGTPHAHRIGELGALLRDAKLTANDERLDVGGFFPAYFAPHEVEDWRAANVRSTQEVFGRETDSAWLAELDQALELEPPEWPAWTPPPLGTVVQRHFQALPWARPDRGAYVGVVSGVNLDRLLFEEKHPCRTCSCRSLDIYGLGTWIVDQYLVSGTRDALEFHQVNGSGADEEGFVTHGEQPYNLRRVPGLKIPNELLRERLRS